MDYWDYWRVSEKSVPTSQFDDDDDDDDIYFDYLMFHQK